MKTTPKPPRKRLFRKLNKMLDSRPKHVKFKGVNGEKVNDRLEILKANYDREIQAKEQELAVLKAKRRSLLEFADESERLRPPEPAPDTYANAGTTEAVLDAVGRLWNAGKGTGYGVTATQVRDFVIAHGFPLTTDPHNFVIAVNITLKRLTASKRIEWVELGSKNYYRPLNAYK